jgi:hypothetical protein
MQGLGLRVSPFCRLVPKSVSARSTLARLDVKATSKLLGFAEHDIQILMAAGKLTPLGEPAQNATKWFAAVQVVRQAGDVDWLHKATKEISKYLKRKRERMSTSPRADQSASTDGAT